jgi:hypothetical protein
MRSSAKAPAMLHLQRQDGKKKAHGSLPIIEPETDEEKHP